MVFNRSCTDNVPQATVVMKHHLTVIIFFILKGFFYLFRMWQEKMLYFINWSNCFTSILLQCRGRKNFYRTAWFLYVFFCIYFSHTKESSLVLWWVWSCCYTERVFFWKTQLPCEPWPMWALLSLSSFHGMQHGAIWGGELSR